MGTLNIIHYWSLYKENLYLHVAGGSNMAAFSSSSLCSSGRPCTPETFGCRRWAGTRTTPPVLPPALLWMSTSGDGGGLSSSTWEVPLRVRVQVPLWVQEATVVPVGSPEVPGIDQHQAVLVGSLTLPAHLLLHPGCRCPPPILTLEGMGRESSASSVLWSRSSSCQGVRTPFSPIGRSKIDHLWLVDPWPPCQPALTLSWSVPPPWDPLFNLTQSLDRVRIMF